MSDAKKADLRVSFDRRLKLKFLGSQITTDAGLLAYRELDETLGLTEMASAAFKDSRVGGHKQHGLFPLLRQSIYSRLAGYEDVNNAKQLAVDPAMRHVVGGRASLSHEVKQWSLTTLREKLVKIGAKVTRHAKYVTFQLDEVAITRKLFAAILVRIELLALPPPIVTDHAE